MVAWPHPKAGNKPPRFRRDPNALLLPSPGFEREHQNK